MMSRAMTTNPEAGLDFTRRFIVEEFTPLFHTPVYRGLPPAVQLRYNQLHALYFNEQVAFFEQAMLSPALRALMQRALPSRLAAALPIFHQEEQIHTARFRELNLRCAPEFYAGRHHYFIRVPRTLAGLLEWVAGCPRAFPLLIWLALLQEERSLYYSKGCLDHAAELEPHFVALHRAHLADETGHVRWDEELLDWLWPRTTRPLRWVNVRLLNWMLGEYFLLPKRSGRQVVEQLLREFPTLDARGLRDAMECLRANAAFLGTLYSREITPRALARFDALPEFALLAETLPGYACAGSPP
jgi:hypothetical protein